MSADPYAAVWPEGEQDIVAALAAVPDEPGPAPAAGVPQETGPRLPRRHAVTRPRFTPYLDDTTRALYAKVADGIRHLDDVRPAPSPVPVPGAALPRGEERFYAETMAAHYGTGPQPVPALPVPDDGRVCGFLARLAGIAADRAEPIFADTCPDCTTARSCRHHEAMREESGGLRRLALALGSAATDLDALLLVIAAAEGDSFRMPAEPAWPGQRDQSADLLTRAESAALPDTAGCCSEKEPCADHAGDMETAALVGAIRDAAIDAGSAAEAAALIVTVITGGGK